MAEGFARHLGEGAVEASSAGLYPASVIQPETFQVMAERQVSLEASRPRSIYLVDGSEIDLLVNMTGEPLSDLLPGFAGREIAWEIRDPIGRPIEVYRSVRDQIEKKVAELVAPIRAKPPTNANLA